MPLLREDLAELFRGWVRLLHEAADIVELGFIYPAELL